MSTLLLYLVIIITFTATASKSGTASPTLPFLSTTGSTPTQFTNADQWIRQGLTFNASGRYQEALDAFLQAVTIDPDNAFVYFNLGTASALLGRYNEAADYLRQAVRSSPDLLPAWSNLGAMYNHLDQPRQTLEAFRQVLRLSPSDANAHFQCGLALLALGETAAARAEYEALKSLDPALAAQLLDKLPPAGK